MKDNYNDIITGVDIGSSKIVVGVAEIDDTGSINVIGVGKSKTNEGVRNGVVININSVVESLNEAISEAEMQSGREIKNVIVGVSGKDVESINSKGVVAISGSDKEIKESDVDRVIEAAKAIALPMDRDILHIIPQWFIVDNQDNVRYPVGMVGTRLESQIHIITTSISSIQNINKCFERVGINIQTNILQNIASSKAILSSDEKELGVLLLDIGAETIKLSLYHRQSPIYNCIYPKLGGYLITNDIAIGLKVSFSVAENIKLEHGVGDFELVDEAETFSIPNPLNRGVKNISKKTLIHIIKPRLKEMFTFIKDDLEKKGFLNNIQAGIVITGGTANLPGIENVAQEVFNLPARIGYIKKLGGLGDKIASPEFAVINGLILSGFEVFSAFDSEKEHKKNGKSLLQKIKDFFSNFF